MVVGDMETIGRIRIIIKVAEQPVDVIYIIIWD
jgi:hypothetical protein